MFIVYSFKQCNVTKYLICCIIPPLPNKKPQVNEELPEHCFSESLVPYPVWWNCIFFSTTMNKSSFFLVFGFNFGFREA